MKLDLRGHQEKYVIEQSMLNLFPGELPVYGTVTDLDKKNNNNNYAIVSSREENINNNNIKFRVSVEIKYHNGLGESGCEEILSGDEYQQEGQRRYWLGYCFFMAARKILKITPPWGMLSGVRPDKIITRALLSGESEADAEKILREKYFVSPDRAAMALQTGRAAFEAKRELNIQDICVYIGVPFCPTRCAYCSFVSQSVEKSYRFIAPYADALKEEIQAGGKLIRDLNLHVRAVYMGGGTPTTFNPAQLEKILRAVYDNFDLSRRREFTVEAGRPDTITEEKLKVLKDYDITRISINPQSMNDQVLQAIGRRHTAEDIIRAMNLAARAGFDNINMDFIAGLPEDTPAGFAKTLNACLKFQPGNITIHTLALKKGSRVLTENLSVPDAADVAKMLDYAAERLNRAGYEPYYLYRQKYMSGSFENTGWRNLNLNFDAGCLYNICEMSELCGIIAFGAGGATKLVKSDQKRTEIKRLFHSKYPEDYLARPDKWREILRQIADFYK